MTGLATRAALAPDLAAALNRARRNDDAVALAYTDLNEFKRVNDGLGHAVGDELLRQVAARLSAVVRPGNFARRFAEQVGAYGLDPGRFVLEIVESSWSLEASRLLPVLERLRSYGLALAIDDFGAGYSSLWRLRELPVQVIKVDRSFLVGVPEDPQATEIFSAILRLPDACGCDVVAEAVETPEQATFLTAQGCRLGQGLHLGRPLPAQEVESVLVGGMAAERRSGGA